MSFYAFAIMALAFEKAQRYHANKKREKVSISIKFTIFARMVGLTLF